MHEGLESAWNALHDAKPDHWYVGQPSEHPERHEWVMYAYDGRERAKAGHRSREWTGVAPTEFEVMREMARCLRILGAGRRRVARLPRELVPLRIYRWRRAREESKRLRPP